MVQISEAKEITEMFSSQTLNYNELHFNMKIQFDYPTL